MSLSPDGTLLAAIHFSGKLSIWAIPSLKLRGEWSQNEQPGYDDLNPDWRLSTDKRRKIKGELLEVWRSEPRETCCVVKVPFRRQCMWGGRNELFPTSWVSGWAL